jgi:hypothetical protein
MYNTLENNYALIGGVCILYIFGTNWDNGSHSGTFYLNWNNVTSNARTNIGTRKLLLPNTQSMPLGKTTVTQQDS